MTIAVSVRIIAIAALVVLLLDPDLARPVLAPLAENGAPAIYNQGSLLLLTWDHLILVFVSTTIGSVVALAAGIFVTRPAGADFLPLSRTIGNIGQTFPPVAVLALAIPAVGFGTMPTLIALVLYGLLPVFENTVTGLREVPPTVLEAARGVGFGPLRTLVQIELPLALPVILGGLRLALVINLGTATLGSTVAAKSLGEVIIAGLQTSNTAFILQGAAIVGLLAALGYDAMRQLERWAARRIGRSD